MHDIELHVLYGILYTYTHTTVCISLHVQVKSVSEFQTNGQLLVRGAVGVSLGGSQFDVVANGNVVVTSQVMFECC